MKLVKTGNIGIYILIASASFNYDFSIGVGIKAELHNRTVSIYGIAEGNANVSASVSWNIGYLGVTPTDSTYDILKEEFNPPKKKLITSFSV